MTPLSNLVPYILSALFGIGAYIAAAKRVESKVDQKKEESKEEINEEVNFSNTWSLENYEKVKRNHQYRRLLWLYKAAFKGIFLSVVLIFLVYYVSSYFSLRAPGFLIEFGIAGVLLVFVMFLLGEYFL